MKMVSELFYTTAVLRVTPVVFTVGERKSVHILCTCISIAVHV
jgi:hypothetical protein